MAACLLAGCSGVPRPPVDTAPAVATIYVVERGWHTDIALPVEEIDARLATVTRSFPGAKYFVFGFGDRAYVLNPSTGFGDMVMALFPGPGAMLVTALTGTPAAAFGETKVVALGLSAPGLDRVSSFLSASFDRTEHPEPAALGSGPYPGSVYYASSATYDAFHTCNTWSAEALRAGGLSVTRFGVVFADQVMDQARALAPPQSMSGSKG